MNSTSLFLWFQLVTPEVGPVLIPRGIIWIQFTNVYKEMLHTKSLSSIPTSFREEEFWSWFSLFLCSNLWPQGWGQFWPKRNHMNTIDKGPQRDAKYKISRLLSFQFQRRRILKMVFFVPMFQLVTPRGGASFDPTSIIWINLVEVHKEMLKTKYQSSTPYSFRGKEFWRWDSLFLCSNLWPPRWDQSWPQEYHLNKLGRGPLEDATYQISKL